MLCETGNYLVDNIFCLWITDTFVHTCNQDRNSQGEEVAAPLVAS